MTIKNAAGAVQSKAAVEAAKVAVTPVAKYTFPAPLFETFALGNDRRSGKESGERKVIVPGVEYTQAQIDALFESAATVTAISPTTGPAAGGTKCTLTGTNLEGVTAITFGGTNATNVNAVNKTTVTCTAPAHAAGAVTVVITDDVTGAITKTTFYTYV